MYVYPGDTSLMNAVWGGYTDIVKILLENGAEANIQNNDGKFLVLFDVHIQDDNG